MLSDLFMNSVVTEFTLGGYLICLLASLILGSVIAFSFSYHQHISRSFQLALFLLPAIVQTVIMMVNGNVGTGVAVAGAFSLVRFRSVPGSAREITAIFLAMATGLATAMGYLGVAVLFVLIICIILLVITHLEKKTQSNLLELKITIPESLNYVHAFDEVFEQYTLCHELLSAKTTNMGSLYKLHYRIALKKQEEEQDFINALRCRNGNLEIMLGIAALPAREELSL
ncbi:MAG: DUF4956 domain-containing protein [Lachnospiraceae bacterium]